MASVTEGAKSDGVVVELFTSLRFEVLRHVGLLGKFMSSVGERALVLPLALTSHLPIAAHFGLDLLLV